MIECNTNNWEGFGLTPASALRQLAIVQQNCLGSWNVFSSLFTSLKTVTPLRLFVLVQDYPIFPSCMPSFWGFKAFAPEIYTSVPPNVACYVHYRLLQTSPINPVFFDCPDWIALDLHTSSGLFDSNHQVWRLYKCYSTNGISSYVRTVSPEKLFQDNSFPCLVVGDFKVHHPVSDSVR